ncbi:MAG: L-threonylcarbamoyladenylate synthase [Arcanobacterium sp.]|nr:L-threonylcarbamoyladenylate synthase [Arcanobacterium sp.]
MQTIQVNTGQAAISAASVAVSAGEVICLPTDTVYGIGANPFDAEAVTRLLTAKSRTRAMPPPVLVANYEQARSLSCELGLIAKELMAKYWPGALTIIVAANPEIGWDLGETNGTVALRMPDQDFTLELLAQIGPLAVTSANKTGLPPAQEISEAQEQLGAKVSLYLDAGRSSGGVPSSIVKLSGAKQNEFEIIRTGAIETEELTEFMENFGGFPACKER